MTEHAEPTLMSDERLAEIQHAVAAGHSAPGLELLDALEAEREARLTNPGIPGSRCCNGGDR